MASPVDQLLGMREGNEIPLPDDAHLAKKCPFLWEFLTRQWWSPGRSRTPGSVTIRLAAGCWQCNVTDAQAKCSKSAVAQRWEDIPAVLEALLADAQVPWKPFGKAQLTKKPQ